ncbi:hypothetical protein D1816_20530 [Aquimarina sp. AD10]|uniref:glycoside hydrolase family 25 protein n=1 Tax=Aquimarina sp. AD10 TaxID=1714849 RepID=UPI000E4CA5DD|nr:GH25 family lysozyme [Aquimarina sp. AD10]AXT62638.1 hypothetical protein D1816_20530 [Aquimarina sp. AD10]RKM98366.1 hypothetical protein D7033_13125 [Aquimarina sp. AD10]
MENILTQHHDIIRKISKQKGSFEIQTILEETFFTRNKNCALVVQNINRYAVLFCEDTIFNEVGKHNKFISSFWKLIALIRYLKDHQYIYSLGGTLTDSKLYAIHPDFHFPKIQGDRIILNDKGWYSMHPDAIFDKNGVLVYKGTIYRDSYYEAALHNLTGVYIVSEKFKELLIAKNEVDKEVFLKKPTNRAINFITWLHFLFTILILVFHFFLSLKFHTHIENNNKYTSSILGATKRIAVSNEINTTQETHFGVDISHYQGNLLKEGLPDTISFVICKATEGVDYIDPDFKNNWEYLKKRNIVRGAYHFYKLKDTPIKQANHFANTVGVIDTHDITPIVDIETLSLQKEEPIDENSLNRNLLLFLRHIEEKFNRIPMIYTSHYFANTHLKDTTLSKYPLWIADYTKSGYPKVPDIWKNKGFKIWQRSDSYSSESTTIDLDIFYGDIEELVDQ